MAAAETIVACETCGMVQRVAPLGADEAAECLRCGSFLATRRSRAALHITAALSLGALALYIPANIFPVLRMSFYGAHSDNTIWDGVVGLAKHDQWLVAAVVFMASIAVPLLKLSALFFLVGASALRVGRRLRTRTALYKLIDRIGPWAMLDVFLVAILVALVKLRDLATIVPGPGLFAFTGVVVLTMLASASFDPKLIWESR